MASRDGNTCSPLPLPQKTYCPISRGFCAGKIAIAGKPSRLLSSEKTVPPLKKYQPNHKVNTPTERRDSEYIFDLGNQFAVDARAKGNKTRRINHADTPHANVRANVINHFGVRKVCMYAARDIDENVELLFDYGPKYWQKRRNHRGKARSSETAIRPVAIM